MNSNATIQGNYENGMTIRGAIIDREHVYAIGAYIAHRDTLDETMTGHEFTREFMRVDEHTWRIVVRNDVATLYPTYTLRTRDGDELRDVLCTEDLISISQGVFDTYA
jgi:hypothetical protein